MNTKNRTVRDGFFAAFAGFFGVTMAVAFMDGNLLPGVVWFVFSVPIMTFGEPADERY